MYEMKQSGYDKECPDGFQSAEYLLAHGQLDAIVPLPSADTEGEPVFGWHWRGDYDEVNAVQRNIEASVFAALNVLYQSSGPQALPSMPSSPPQSPVKEVSAQPSKLAIHASAGQEGAEGLDYTASRAMDRAQGQDAIDILCDEYFELRGDGKVASDACVRGGLAVLRSTGDRCVIIATTK